MRTLSVLNNRVFDVGCFLHTLDHVEEKIKTPLVDEFFKQWMGCSAALMDGDVS